MAIANGEVADADEVLAITKIQQVYTATGFNSTRSGTAGTDEQSHELNAVTIDTDVANFEIVKITGSAESQVVAATNAVVSIKAQIKETSGAYGDIHAYVIFCNGNNTSGADQLRLSNTIEFVATLTAGMKTNGFQIKVFSRSVTTGTGTQSANFTNIQTTQEMRA